MTHARHIALIRDGTRQAVDIDGDLRDQIQDFGQRGFLSKVDEVHRWPAARAAGAGKHT